MIQLGLPGCVWHLVHGRYHHRCLPESACLGETLTRRLILQEVTGVPDNANPGV